MKNIRCNPWFKAENFSIKKKTIHTLIFSVILLVLSNCFYSRPVEQIPFNQEVWDSYDPTLSEYMTEYQMAKSVVESFLLGAAARDETQMDSTLYHFPAYNKYYGLEEKIYLIPRTIGKALIRLPWPVSPFELEWFNYEEYRLLEGSKAYYTEGTPKAGDLETIVTIPVTADSVLNLWFLLRQNAGKHWRILGWQRHNKPYAHMVDTQLLIDVMPPASELPFPQEYLQLLFVNNTPVGLEILINLNYPDSSLQRSFLEGGVSPNDTTYIGEHYQLQDSSRYKGLTIYAFKHAYVQENFPYDKEVVTPEKYLSPDSVLGKWVLTHEVLDSVGWRIVFTEGN